MNNLLFFDTETTGLPPKKADYRTDYEQFPHLVQLAWHFNGELKNYLILPDGYEIPAEAIAVHGITNERAWHDGYPLYEVASMFLTDCLCADRLVGHNIYFDVSTIKANIIRSFGPNELMKANIALDKSKRIDTMYKAMKLVGSRQANGAGKFPTLEETYLYLFGETFPAHNAAEDVRATKRVFDELQRMEIITL